MNLRSWQCMFITYDGGRLVIILVTNTQLITLSIFKLEYYRDLNMAWGNFALESFLNDDIQ